MNININTNVDRITKEVLVCEARISKNRARVNLLTEIHNQLEETISMETAYGYDPAIDMSFTGEFEAIS
jgi:hypothetical protein